MAECACVSRSATLCWAERYYVEPMEVEADGGPCMCSCHDGCDDDDWGDDEDIVWVVPPDVDLGKYYA